MFTPYLHEKRDNRVLTTVQSDYAAVLAKRVSEAKAIKADARKRRASSMRK